ncbi:zinc finger protein OZF-like [Haliotis rufescens]|uniref:zinc finger protein OZF-like n=1 Tax=Haliotis rufescens TaxID=6454 RepID=UPI00201F0F30|nr:zinc finger protein OZF-like [Haliotis rufescens]XP_046356746.2 zinc finger protein OZF-like [Haliotis rufescens]
MEKCSVCKKKFYSTEAFKFHLKTHTVTNSLQCVECKKTFSQYKHFEVHQRIHFLENQLKSKTRSQISEKTFQCSICFKGFSLLKQLEAHKRIHVLEKRFFKCTVCGIIFTQPHILRSHMEIHKTANLFVCKACDRTFTKADELLTHMKSHPVVVVSPPPKCDLCGKYTTNMKNHMNLMHPKSEETFICGVCGMKFNQCAKLEVHMKIHTEYRLKKCHVCGEGFKRAAALRKHTLTHMKEKMFGCKICGRTMTKLPIFICHVRIHTGERPHECKVCGERFRFSSTLFYHMQAHVGERPHSCAICEKRFIHMRHLTKHMSTMHVKKTSSDPTPTQGSWWQMQHKTSLYSKSLKFTLKKIQISERKTRNKQRHSPCSAQCQMCEKTFLNLDRLNFHLRNLHPEVKFNYDDSSFTCMLCQRTFQTNKTFSYHMDKIHEIGRVSERLKGRRFQCDVCEKLCGSKASLTKHASKHKLDFSYTCGVCGGHFPCCEVLTQHMELEHFDKDHVDATEGAD